MMYIIFSLFCGASTDYCIYRHFKPLQYPWTWMLSLAACSALYFTFDDSVWIIKGFIFAQMLIIIGYSDAKTHEISDWLYLPILLDGLLLFQPEQAFIGLFSVSLLLLLFAKVTGGAIGGGDVKLMAANGFVLGPGGAVCGTLIGLALFLLMYPIFYREKKQKGYAMAPYLGIGCFLAYILKI